MGRKKTKDDFAVRTSPIQTTHITYRELVEDMETYVEEYGDFPVVGMGNAFGYVGDLSCPYTVVLSNTKKFENKSIYLRSRKK